MWLCPFIVDAGLLPAAASIFEEKAGTSPSGTKGAEGEML